MKNANMHKARASKNDEFYTLIGDIENELKHYKEHLKGKVVYCNCDHPDQSNFFKYFAQQFKTLGLKKLIATSFNAEGNGWKAVIESAEGGDDKKVQIKRGWRLCK